MLFKCNSAIVEKLCVAYSLGSLFEKVSTLETENMNVLNHISHLHFSVSLPTPFTTEVCDEWGLGLPVREEIFSHCMQACCHYRKK